MKDKLKGNMFWVSRFVFMVFETIIRWKKNKKNPYFIYLHFKRSIFTYLITGRTPYEKSRLKMTKVYSWDINQGEINQNKGTINEN